LLPLCNHSHPMVQAGMFGALRNCLDDDAQHTWLLEEVKVLPIVIKGLRPHLERLEQQVAAALAAAGRDESEAEMDAREEREKAERSEEVGGEKYETVHLKHLVECVHYLSTNKENRAFIRENQGELYPLLRDISLQLKMVREKTPVEKEASGVVFEIIKWLKLLEEVKDEAGKLSSDFKVELDDQAEAEDVD
jgi:hypothetical protein